MILKDSGARETWETGANRDVSAGKGRFDLLPMWAIERLAKLYEAGCMKYGDRNWEKGIPVARYTDSALRHLCKFIRGDNDEDHLVAAAWNIMCAMDTEARVELGMLPKSLLDLPRYERTRIQLSPNGQDAENDHQCGSREERSDHSH